MERSFQLDDNYKGHQELVMYLKNHSSEGKTIICGLESTGGYEQNWLTVLKRISKQLPVEVYKLNPKGVKHQIESTLKRTITDSVSAEGIANYVANNYQQKKQDWHKSTHQGIRTGFGPKSLQTRGQQRSNSHNIQTNLLFAETSILQGKIFLTPFSPDENDVTWLRVQARLLMAQGKFDQSAKSWTKIAESKRNETTGQNQKSYGW